MKTLEAVAILGAGTMGSIIARALIEQKVIAASNLIVVETTGTKGDALAASLGCESAQAVAPEVGNADVIVLAVKPQDARAACAGLTPYVKERQLVLSIMAGVTTSGLSEMLDGHKRVVRSMPNLPMKVGRGMTVFFAAPEVGETERVWLDKILTSCGLALEVQDEDLLNASTAVNGTGPAYLYYLMEHLLSATCSLGFTEEQARILVRQTLQGSLELWDESGISPRELRLMVTSKGGTTAAAIATFEAGKLGEVLQKGILAACRRARELSKT